MTCYLKYNNYACIFLKDTILRHEINFNVFLKICFSKSNCQLRKNICECEITFQTILFFFVNYYFDYKLFPWITKEKKNKTKDRYIGKVINFLISIINRMNLVLDYSIIYLFQWISKQLPICYIVILHTHTNLNNDISNSFHCNSYIKLKSISFIYTTITYKLYRRNALSFVICEFNFFD